MIKYLTAVFQIKYDDDHGDIEYWLNNNAKKSWALHSVTALESLPSSVLIVMEREDEETLVPISAISARNNFPDVGPAGFDSEIYLSPMDNPVWQDVFGSDEGDAGAADTDE